MESFIAAANLIHRLKEEEKELKEVRRTLLCRSLFNLTGWVVGFYVGSKVADHAAQGDPSYTPLITSNWLPFAALAGSSAWLLASGCRALATTLWPHQKLDDVDEQTKHTRSVDSSLRLGISATIVVASTCVIYSK